MLRRGCWAVRLLRTLLLSRLTKNSSLLTFRVTPIGASSIGGSRLRNLPNARWFAICKFQFLDLRNRKKWIWSFLSNFTIQTFEKHRDCQVGKCLRWTCRSGVTSARVSLCLRHNSSKDFLKFLTKKSRKWGDTKIGQKRGWKISRFRKEENNFKFVSEPLRIPGLTLFS